ncbi:MAG TPA: hypothetical protein VGB73_01195 [Pyrinomonadaceae bacterium]|jgi:hypothetical protein
MNGKMNESERDERLDLIGRVLLRASARNESEAEAAASSPFLYTRVRARIAAERERREAGEGWLALLSVAWRSVPALALVAVFAFVLFWFALPNGQSPTVAFSDEALLGEREAGIEHVVFAERNALSSDEVLASILNEDETEASR